MTDTMTAKAYRRKHVPTEHAEQAQLFEVAAIRAERDGRWGMLYAIPNGGDRHPAVGAALKAEGVKAGVPDVHLPVPVGRHHGLYIELKRTVGGRVEQAQAEWIEDLQAQGYRVEVCRGCDAAVAAITEYLGRLV